MERFRVFKEVEAKNITLASKNLHLSQPSISLQIQALEKEYAVRLLDRTNKGVTLTNEGKIFYERICIIVDLFTSLKEEISIHAKEQRSIFIGATLTIGEYILPNIMEYLFKAHPFIDFKVKISKTESIIQDVTVEKINLGLIDGTVTQHRDLLLDNFWDDELVVVIPHFHPWKGRNNISLAELTNKRLIIREEDSGTRKTMETVLKENGLDLNYLNVTMELESIQSIKKAVSAGLGITIISSLTVSSEYDQKIFKTLKVQDASICRHFSIITNTKTTQTKGQNYMINLLKDRELLSDLLRKVGER
jgi:LysR family transcriptional regulator, transcriptional activator of the cysJI operon